MITTAKELQAYVSGLECPPRKLLIHPNTFRAIVNSTLKEAVCTGCTTTMTPTVDPNAAAVVLTTLGAHVEVHTSPYLPEGHIWKVTREGLCLAC